MEIEERHITFDQQADIFNEPIHVMSYILPEREIKMFKMDDFTWIVLSVDVKNPEKSKAIVCISYEHAGYIFEGCVEAIKPYNN